MINLNPLTGPNCDTLECYFEALTIAIVFLIIAYSFLVAFIVGLRIIKDYFKSRQMET